MPITGSSTVVPGNEDGYLAQGLNLFYGKAYCTGWYAYLFRGSAAYITGSVQHSTSNRAARQHGGGGQSGYTPGRGYTDGDRQWQYDRQHYDSFVHGIGYAYSPLCRYYLQPGSRYRVFSIATGPGMSAEPGRPGFYFVAFSSCRISTSRNFAIR